MFVLSAISRVAAFMVGFALVWISLFFIKDDEGKVQNWLVSLWVRVERLSEERRSRTVAFFNEIATEINSILDKTFGVSLVSVRFVVVSATLSVGSLYLISALRFPKSWLYMLPVSCVSLVLTAVVLKKPTLENEIAAGLLLMAILFMANLGSVRSAEFAFAGTVCGILFDWTFVAISRKLLRKIEAGHGLKQICIALAVSLILGVILLAPS